MSASGPSGPLVFKWNLGDFFPNFEKKNPNLKNFFFMKIGIFIQSTHTHTHTQATW